MADLGVLLKLGFAAAGADLVVCYVLKSLMRGGKSYMIVPMEVLNAHYENMPGAQIYTLLVAMVGGWMAMRFLGMNVTNGLPFL